MQEKMKIALTTFSSIMGFAAEMVKQAEETYKTLASKEKDSALKEVLEYLSAEERKNHTLNDKGPARKCDGNDLGTS